MACLAGRLALARHQRFEDEQRELADSRYLEFGFRNSNFLERGPFRQTSSVSFVTIVHSRQVPPRIFATGAEWCRNLQYGRTAFLDEKPQNLCQTTWCNPGWSVIGAYEWGASTPIRLPNLLISLSRGFLLIGQRHDR